MINNFNIVIFITFFYFFSCVEKNEINSVEKGIEVKSHKIKSFLGLKKGMSSNDVFELFDSKSIKHSGLISSFKLKDGDDWEGNPYFRRSLQIKYIEVYDYPIENQNLDRFNLYFVNDILFELSFYRKFESHSSDLDRAQEARIISREYGQIVLYLNDVLIEKYGIPIKDSPSSNFESDTPDLNLDLNLNDKSSKRSSYVVRWQSANLNKDLTIDVQCGQKLEFLNEYFYSCYYYINVDFANENVKSMLHQIYLEKRKIEDKIKADKLKKELKAKQDI